MKSPRPIAQRPPLWLVGLAACFCAYFGLLVYCDVARPANAGFVTNASPDGQIQVVIVAPNSAAARAGMQVDDRILSINGARIATARARKDVGINALMGPNRMVVRRGTSEVELTLILEPAPRSFWRTRAGSILLIVRIAQFLMLLSGLLILARRPRDPVALTASWFLLTCAIFTIALPWRLATVWRGLPAPLGALLLIPHASGLVVGPVALTFVASFPRRLPHAGYVQAATWIVAGAALAVPLANFIELIYGGRVLKLVGPGSRPLLAVTTLSLAAAVIIVMANYRRIDDINERRRVRALVAGLAVGVIPGFPVVAWYWYRGSGDLATSIFESPGLAFAAVVMLSLPLSFTYALLRHRLFDIRFILRLGLRYALARRLLLSLLPALVTILALDLLAHGHETINAMLRRRAPVYAGIAVGGLAIYRWRQRWLEALDRRFFRERQDGYAMLRDVAEHLRRSGSLDQVAPRVVATIESAMHPEFAALLVHKRLDSVFRTIAAAPAASAVPDLRADSKLVALARVLEKPLDTSPEGDVVRQQLPAAEAGFVTRAGIDLLIPVVTSDDQLYGLLALGRKRSEEPYSGEDQNVLATIAENVALLAARSVPERESPMLEECLACGQCFDAGMRICERDSGPLVMRALPRALAARYRLDRRIATGGMGTVYEALDTALDRLVAVKVVREDLVVAPGAADRFFDEARLAARLMHPNVVTVHDFGIVAGRQPFLVMERLVGRTLRKEMDDGAGLPPDMILSILGGVCMAVDAAHRLRLLHRDLKPENIFLVEGDAGPIPKVLDFGVARPFLTSSTPASRSLTRPGMIIGTPEYMAPEQLRGDPPSPAWDLWSLAVIALEALGSIDVATHQPGRVAPLAAPMELSVWDPARRLRETHPCCAEFFTRALSLDPAQRPPDARSLYTQLEHAVHADGVGSGRAAGGHHEYVLTLWS